MARRENLWQEVFGVIKKHAERNIKGMKKKVRKGLGVYQEDRKTGILVGQLADACITYRDFPYLNAHGISQEMAWELKKLYHRGDKRPIQEKILELMRVGRVY